MRGAPFLAAACAIALVAFLSIGLLEERVLAVLFGLECRARLFDLTCAYAPDGAFEPEAYYLLVGLALATLGASFAFWRRSVVHPFLATFAVLALFSLGYDLTVGKPVIHGPKIINDTMNVLSFVILASFLLTFFMARRQGIGLPRVASAVATSYGVKILALAAFVTVHETVMGATELFFLYVVYAFGAFTIHIMTVSALIMGLQPERRAA